jgi:lysine biosynthesis protein LysW
MKTDKQTPIATCPDCAEEFHLGTSPKLDLKVTCPNCKSHLKVVSLNPLELDWDIDNLKEDEQLREYWKEECW